VSTGRIDSGVVLDRLLSGGTEGADFSLVSPEEVVVGVLLLNELVVPDVGGQEGGLLSGVAVLGEVTECASKLVFAVFPRYVPTVPWNLRPRISLAHSYNFQLSATNLQSRR
jgi:hypothetical protein